MVVDGYKDFIVVSLDRMHVMLGGDHVVGDIVGGVATLYTDFTSYAPCFDDALGEWRDDGEGKGVFPCHSIDSCVAQSQVSVAEMGVSLFRFTWAIEGLCANGIYTIRQVGELLVGVEVMVEVLGILLRVCRTELVTVPACEHVAVEARIDDAGRHIDWLAVCRIALPNLIHIFQVTEVVSDDGIDEFLSPCIIAVACIHAYIVGKNDSGRSGSICGVGQILDDGGIGMCGIVAVAVARRDFLVNDKGNVEPGCFRVGRGKVINPDDARFCGGLVLGAEVEQLLYGGHLTVQVAFPVRLREVLHIELCSRSVRSDDLSVSLCIPVQLSRPALEEASYRSVGILVAAEQQYLPAHLPYCKRALELNEEVLQVVAIEQFQQSLAVIACIVIAVGSMKEVNHGKLRRTFLKFVAQEIKSIVEAEVGGHDAMIDVDIIVLDARTKVEGTYTRVPLFLEALVLRAGILVAERSIDRGGDAWEAVACARVVATGNGERGDVCVVWKALHPVVSL